ncbi:carbohydrate ABC transporter permease [Alkalibacillus haloalkaliphilus]|uniref:Glycerol-3-phosphate ABC transporter permease n=1 Tax=Alkalibacillus haloalkaliphilus TaxID=94136 RepID=A0A511W5L1_9BACI|nr:sugar ABC transporter permease [Alkalibacillus haloalkaliphilus]MDV2581646.1 sugar ABC transporter permease [Alkalibacillus haloalkaliphilus]GEN46247.1 glycerol-3-phosphate ABC transporter permease [Alkalibacillus haloalkaliphilus]
MTDQVAAKQLMDPASRDKEKRKKARKNFWTAMLFMLPAIAIIGFFLFYPMFKTLYFSFFVVNSRGDTISFAGLSNYLYLWESSTFRTSMKATFLFALYTVPTTILVSLFLAVITNEKVRGIPFFRVAFSSTLGVSVAAGATIWLILLHPSVGVFNNLLAGIGFDRIGWLTSSTWALISVSITTIWMNLGFNFIILLGGLQNISEELYESARVDGAGYWTQLFKITIPLLSPTLFFVSVVTIINSFQSFGQVDILTGGGPNNSTNLIVYSIYREAFESGFFGTASAQAMILFALVLILTIIQFKFVEKKVHYQ